MNIAIIFAGGVGSRFKSYDISKQPVYAGKTYKNRVNNFKYMKEHN